MTPAHPPHAPQEPRSVHDLGFGMLWVSPGGRTECKVRDLRETPCGSVAFVPAWPPPQAVWSNWANKQNSSCFIAPSLRLDRSIVHVCAVHELNGTCTNTVLYAVPGEYTFYRAPAQWHAPSGTHRRNHSSFGLASIREVCPPNANYESVPGRRQSALWRVVSAAWYGTRTVHVLRTFRM